jgi:hypothetical protein
MKNVNKILTTLSLSASDTREDTIKSIIKTTLLESKDPINLKTLKENIDIIYDIELYDVEFNAILKKLNEAEEIHIEKELYSLLQDEKRKLIEIAAKLKSGEVIRFQNFKSFIDGESTIKFGDEEIKLLWNTLKDYLYGCFYQYGVKAIEYLHPQYAKPDSVNLNHGEVFNDAVKKLGKKELTNVFKISVDKFPDYATKEDLDFIDEIGQKTLAFASLGLSPEQAKEDLDSELIDWTLYLDTNFLFSVLDLHSNVENEACKELLKLVILNKDIIKIKFRYSELTLKELRHKKTDFASLDESLTNSAIRAILKSDELDDFARKYYCELLKNRDETIHPTKIIDLAEITLPKEGIEISRNQKQTESLNQEYIDIRIVEYQRYINEINEVRSDFSKKNHTNFRQYYRSDSQITHDIVLREIILSSRRLFKKDEIKTFNEVKYFGLTIDDLLIKFDGRQNISSGIYKYPTFFKPSYLLNKLVKLLPIKTPNYKKAFIKAVSSIGFYKEPQKSNDIIKVASYLKKYGIDNENVLLNLISEKLFMEKFHQESSNPDFNSEVFFESELNKILALKEKEVTDSKIQLTKLVEISQYEKEEKEKLKIQKENKEKEIILFNTAVKQLQGQVKKLQEKATVNVIEPKINFDVADMQAKLNIVQSQLESEKRRNSLLENEKRTSLRNKFIKRKVFFWRLKSFIWILLLPLSFLLLYCFLKDSQYFPAIPKEKNIDSFLSTNLARGILVVTTIIYQAIFITIFTSKYLQTNKCKYLEQLNIPENLKEIKF